MLIRLLHCSSKITHWLHKGSYYCNSILIESNVKSAEIYNNCTQINESNANNDLMQVLIQ